MRIDAEKFLNPTSISIIGASENPKGVPGRLVRCLTSHGFDGTVFPINPKYKELYGYKCYPSILDIPTICDLAIIVVQANLVIGAIEQCITRGCKNILIVSSGFSEVGSDGGKLQSQLENLVKGRDMVILGPNSQGFFNVKNHIAANFSPTMELTNPVVGPVGFVSQSGAVGYSIYAMAQDEGIGTGYIIATGNEMSASIVDFLEYFVGDQDIKIMVAYAESLKNGRRLPEIGLKALESEKPIFLYKVGRSDQAKKAAMSHTGSLAGNDEVLSALCKQYGIIRPEEVRQINDAIKVFLAGKKLPLGKGVGIISTSGGLAVTMADVCSDLGLEIPEFSEDTHNKLAQVIPDLGTTHNPVDVSAQILVKLDAFKKAMKIIIADDKVDILVVLISALTGAIADMIANDIVEVFKESEKLIAVGWSGSETLYGSAKNILTNAKVPIYKTPPQVAKALHPLITFSETRRTWLQNKKSFANSFQINTARQSKAKSYISGKRNILTEYESKQLLSMYGITVTNEYLAVNPQEAAEKAKNIGFPVAIKVNSSLTPHKSDIGGLKINIKNSDEAILAYREIIDNISKSLCVNTIKEVLVQEMVTGGHEVILGALNDPDYGPVVMFGMGGIFVEVLKDVSYRVAPLDYWDAMAMIDEVKGSTILKGARGKARGDINALANAIVAFSQMIVELESDFKEIDVNPLVVLPEGNGIKVVDALIITNN